MGLLRWVPLIYTAVFTIAFVFIGLKSALVDLEPNNCKMTYMWPQYVPVKGMKHPKYDLYFYREGETKPIKSIPKLNGVPVLFIPGNAGSYRQVRSLGSVSAWTHSSRNLSDLHDSDLHHIKLQAPPVRGKKLNEFDFFTADFDEELTALNGDLLFNQIDFVNDCIKHILSLYSGEKGQKPTSVILVGHSMGGLVARGVFAAANYNQGSIKTIITINSPHRIDPVLFHRSSGKSYRIVNGFWKEELYNPEKIANSALKDVAVLSIAGGNRDIQVSSDLSSLELIAPETHQFSTIATSVPYVWLSTDHLSSVWCNQLVYVLSETLFALIDPATGQDSYALEDRIRIFKQNFQSKLPEALSFVDELPDLHRGTVQDTEKWIGRPYAEAFVHHHTITQTKHMKWHISENYHEYKFTMVTGLAKENITAKLCKTDFVDCLDLSDKITPVLHSVEPGVREFDTKIVPMSILVLMPDALKGNDLSLNFKWITLD
jgi:pimeloyl-ACP methyl ester carboxylesterase